MNFNKDFSLDFLLLTSFIVIISGGSPFLRDNVSLFILFLLLLSIFIYYRLRPDHDFIILALIWVVTNFVAIFFINEGRDGSFVTVFSRLMKFALIYVLLKVFQGNFFEKLNQYLYVLVVISLVLFTLQIAFPSLIKSFAKLFSFMTYPSLIKYGCWYGFFYMYNGWAPERNSGFMWEPGAFAGMLILIITYRLSVNKFQMDKYIYVYAAALITTFSTAGYLAFVFILVALFIHKGKRYLYLVLLLPPIIYVGYNFFINSDFLFGKINTYLEVGTDAWGKGTDGSARTTRLGFFLIILEESIRWPFGYGVVEYSDYVIRTYGRIYGPGTLSQILHQWGWVGLVGCFWYLYKFYRLHLSPISSLLFTLSMGIILFSNPEVFLYILLSIVFYLIIYDKQVKLINQIELMPGRKILENQV